MSSFLQIGVKQFITYCLIGLVNTGIHFFAFLLFLNLIGLQAIANFLGFTLGLLFSFFMNSCFTFKKRPSFVKFLKMALTNGGLAFLFGFLGDCFEFRPLLTFGLYISINPVLGFLLTKYFVFSSK